MLDGPGPAVRAVLNVGGNSKEIAIPKRYAGWTHHLLDIDPTGRPDVLCDARELTTLEKGAYDAIYCSHNLEHFYFHDVPKVLAGFLHVLKPDGFAEIRVPDLGKLFETVVANKLDVTDTVYVSKAGPIAVLDMIYGFRRKIETSGVDFFAHKTGFTVSSLKKALGAAGFVSVLTRQVNHEIRCIAFRGPRADWHRPLFWTAEGQIDLSV